MNRIAKAALESVVTPDAPSQALVFDGLCGEYVAQMFRQACSDVGIEDFRFHDLRHTAASWMRMSGADIHTGLRWHSVTKTCAWLLAINT